ncbi:hypothetical protein N7478_005943 [Penicillium angulare]|uniref:uncharacterized protein n=1 Tax=Penicillium angulare TaxID=116970 RepID=UPI00254088EC|nr:uncharacterized protein N7478_005943 [Penicillium angulare]KAJ5280571.1 hypothetical protein N7478_005943 [Penicillium angulare]
MVPAFITRHPPPPSTSTSSTTPYYSYDGPALAPAKTIKPAPETSKDFFRNMRDLQNCMADFSDVHDAAVSAIAPLTNFSNERLSSALFLAGTVAAALLFVSAHLLPIRLVLLAGGNAAILSNNPKVRQFFQGLLEDVGGLSDLDSPIGDGDERELFGQSIPATPTAAVSAMEKLADISLDTDPEEREVEVFEVQHRVSERTLDSEWEHFLFSPLPYDPLSPSRIAGDRPRGCRFFDDVRTPSGWKWKSKKWELDLDCREWVIERMITGVGFEVPGVTPEGNAIIDEIGGWVWDLPGESSPVEDEEIPTMAYGDLQPETGHAQNPPKDKQVKSNTRDWEEGTPASFGVGEWRRRRWVRIVQRMNVPPAGTSTVTYSTLSH